MIKCKYGDPTCPCQDGDPCHYEGENPMNVPPEYMQKVIKEQSDELRRKYTQAIIKINKEATDKTGQLRAEIKRRDEALENMCRQFACNTLRDNVFCLWHGGLSVLEEAFDILGWEHLHPVPDMQCQHEGCCKEATCGTPTEDGYKLLCGEHFDEVHLQELR